MTRRKYTVSSNVMLGLADALLDFYGEGVTVHYTTSRYLIFSCPAISEKVIRVDNLSFFYGDAWTSGTSIINQKQFQGVYTLNGLISYTLVLDDSFMFLNSISINGDVISSLTIIGKATNGDTLVFGHIAGSEHVHLCRGYNATKSIDIQIVSLSQSFFAPDGSIIKMPLIITDMSNVMQINGDGSPLGIDGIYLSSYTTAPNMNIVHDNYIVSTTQLYTSGVKVKRLLAGLLVEY